MNLDVTPGSQPDGTYRRAENWIYGQALDALVQEPGSVLVETINGKHVIGGYAVDDDTFVLFVLDFDSLSVSGSAILRYNVSSDTVTTVLADNGLAFQKDTVFSIATYKNAQGERQVIFSDNVNPVRIVNIDAASINLGLTPLFPNFDIPLVTLNGIESGGLPRGMYYVAIRYIDLEGNRTTFSDITGPFAISENGARVRLDVQGLDTDYEFFELGVLAVVDNAISVTIQDRRAIINQTSITASFSGDILEELQVEDLTVTPVTYKTAKTVALHNKRLYLGNLVGYETENLQSSANLIQPLWTLADASPTTPDDQYPTDSYFMFNEVYAFYVNYIRADGSMSEAFHIPGRPIPSTATIRTVTYLGAGDLPPQDTVYSMTDDLDTIGEDTIIFTGNENVDGTKKLWHFESTATISTNGTKGQCGYWENENEVYASDFPLGSAYTWNGDFTTSTQSNSNLAGQKVRHHKMPSKKFLVSHNAPLNDAKGLKVDFTNVSIPNGYVGAKFFYASRKGYKGTVVTQDYAFYGQPNFYSGYGAGGTEYQGYYSSSITNRPYRSFRYVPSQPNDSAGDTLDVASANWHSAWGSRVTTTTDFKNTIEPDFCTLHSFDLLDDRPALGSDLYIRVETGEGYGEVPSAGDDGDDWYYGLTYNAMIDDDTATLAGDVEDYFFEATPNTLGRNKRVNTGKISGPSLPDDYNLNPGTNADRYIMMPTIGASIPIEKIEYVPADTVSDSLEFDNRFGPECVGVVLGGDQTAPVFQMFDDTDTTVTSGSYRYGSFMDAKGGKIPMISVLVMRNTLNVYTSYQNQDLVACTNVKAPTGGIIAGALGDVVYSHQVTRVTGATGWNAHHPHQPASSAISGQPVNSTNNAVTSDITNPTTVLALLTSRGTVDYSRGFMAARYELERLTPVNFAHLDNEHTDLSVWDRLNESTNAERNHKYELEGTFKSENVFLQPILRDSVESEVYEFPNRVVRSEASQPADTRFRYKTFKPLDFYEQEQDRGSITKIISYGDKVLIHHEQGLYVTVGQEKLASTAGDIALGLGDIFRIPPKEVVTSEYGQAGLEYQLAATMTPAGYFFVDTFQRKVYLFNGKLNDLTRAGMRSYFQEHLEFEGWTTSEGTSTGAGAVSSFYPGIHVEYDPEYNRVVMLVRNHKRRQALGGAVTASNIPDSNASYLSDSTIQVLDETISFSFDNMAWVSFHTYRQDFMLATTRHLFSVVNETNAELHRHNDFSVEPGNFLGKTRLPAYIDVAIPSGGNALYQGFVWNTRAVDISPEIYYQDGVESTTGKTRNFTDHLKTFVSAVVYTDTHCSGEVALVTPSVTDGELQSTNLRRVEGYWRFNGFRDTVLDRDARFMDAFGNLITSNLDPDMEWYNKRRITGTYAVIRLITDASDNSLNALYLLSVEAKARKLTR